MPTARDAQHSVKTDMYFIEAQPFEREYSQSQQAGGGGGGQGRSRTTRSRSVRKRSSPPPGTSRRTAPRNAKEAREDARFLSDTQGKLGQQAKTLAERMRSRQLAGANQEFQSFAKDMEQAATEMGTAVG